MPTDITEYFQIPEDRAPPGDYPARLVRMDYTTVRLGQKSRHQSIDRIWHYWIGLYRIDDGPHCNFPVFLSVCLDTYDNPGSFFHQILLAYRCEIGRPPEDLFPREPDTVKRADLLNKPVVIQVGYLPPKFGFIPVVLRIKPPDGVHRDAGKGPKRSCGSGMRVFRA